MIPSEIEKMKSLLDSFLGESKSDLDESYQIQYGCPRCIEEKGESERRKYNLEVNLKLGVYNAWCCSQSYDEMHGSILKLIRLYGNETILKEYKEAYRSLRDSKLYELKFSDGDFNIEFTTAECKEVELPSNFKRFVNGKYNNFKALKYLQNRGIDWDIIEKHNIGYTVYDDKQKQLSSRIIIPSYNQFGELNYWTGRDFTNLENRQKYFNPILERKNTIFNEELVQWDADITLVEGPFDHIVVPNSIPLLGKVLKRDFTLFQKLYDKANANINIFLDGDAYNDVVKIYKLLNHDRLYGKIRWIPTSEELDPSKIFELYGRKGIVQHLRNATEIKEVYLF